MEEINEKIERIKLKTQELQNALVGDFFIKVYYFKKGKNLRIFTYSEKEYEKVKDLDLDNIDDIDINYTYILYDDYFDTHQEVIVQLDDMLENISILKTKLKIIKLQQNTYKTNSTQGVTYNYFSRLSTTKEMNLMHDDSITTSYPEHLDVALNTHIYFNTDNNTFNLNISSKIKYEYQINITNTKFIDGIKFDVHYDDGPDECFKNETFKCTFNNVKLNDIFKTIKRIKTIMINNSHLIRLCHNYETK